MNAFIFTLEQEFQPYLRQGDYTFTGPADQDFLGNFISTVNLIAPSDDDMRTIDHALSDKNAVRQALSILFDEQSLTVYVAEGAFPHGLVYSTIEEYCQKFGISFSMANK